MQDPLIEALQVANRALAASVRVVDKHCARPVEGGVFIPADDYDRIREALASCDDAHRAVAASLVPVWGAIERKAVESSNVASIGYDTASNTLEVEFKNGGVYRYLYVSISHWVDIQKAPSVGKFLNEHIKPAHHCEKQPALEAA